MQFQNCLDNHWMCFHEIEKLVQLDVVGKQLLNQIQYNNKAGV
jgi:hypothetical protein